MIVSVKLFAAARQAVDQDCVEVELPDGASIDDLQQAMIDQHPPLERLVPHAMYSVNAEYAPKNQIVSPDDEIALIPPVSGG